VQQQHEEKNMGAVMVTQQQLADIVERDRVSIYRLQKKGLPFREGSGSNNNRYHLSFSIHWIVGNDLLLTSGNNPYTDDPAMVAAIGHSLAFDGKPQSGDVELGVSMIIDALQIPKKQAEKTYFRAMGYMERVHTRGKGSPRIGGRFI